MSISFVVNVGGNTAFRDNMLISLRGTPALHLNEPAGGSCCDAGLGLVWHCYCIYMTFVCLIQKKIFALDFEGPRLCRIQK